MAGDGDVAEARVHARHRQLQQLGVEVEVDARLTRSCQQQHVALERARLKAWIAVVAAGQGVTRTERSLAPAPLLPARAWQPLGPPARRSALLASQRATKSVTSGKV